MKSNSFDEINNFIEDHKKSKNCEHSWDYTIEIVTNSNVYIEKCYKCFKTIKTHELFNNKKN